MAKGAYVGIEGIARKIVEGYIGVESANRALPTGYTQIKYLSANGKQHINTGYKPKSTTRVVMCATILKGDGSDRCLFGARNTINSNEFTLWIDGQSTTGVTSGYNADKQTVDFGSLLGRHVFDKNRDKLYIDSRLVIDNADSTFSTSYPLYLFENNNASYQSNLQCDGYIHYCRIYEDDVLVRDFIPCKNSSGVAGLYDLVNGAFYASASDTAFGGISSGTITGLGVARKIKKAYIGVGGATYREVEYIESSGTQYIDTQFKPKYNTRVVMDVSGIPATTNYVFGARNANSATASQQFGFFRNSATTIRSDYFGKNNTANVSDTTGRTTIDMNGNVTTAFGVTITNTAVTSGECTYPLYLFAVNNVGTAGVLATARVYSCKIYDNGTLVRDLVPVINPSGVPGLFDKVGRHFFANAGTGNFTAGAETGSTHTSLGVARPCWAGGKPVYYGAITSLSTARQTPGAASNGKYAIFAAGYSGSASYMVPTAVVEAYDSSLTLHSASNFASTRNPAAAKAGIYVVVAGGRDCTAVKAYDLSLTAHTLTNLSRGANDITGATVGNKAVFAYYSTYGVVAYDSSLTRTVGATITVRSNASAASNKKYALINVGGSDAGSQSEYSTGYAFNESLTMTNISLSAARGYAAGASLSEHAIFAGGAYQEDFGDFNSAAMSTVDAFDTSLTRVNPSSLGANNYMHAGGSNGTCAVFSGGIKGYTNAYVYDAKLVRTTLTGIGYCNRPSAANIDDYIIFAGGLSNKSAPLKNAYAYTLA